MGLANFAEEDKAVGSEAWIKGRFVLFCFVLLSPPPLFTSSVSSFLSCSFFPFAFEVDQNITTDKEYKQYVPFSLICHYY